MTDIWLMAIVRNCRRFFTLIVVVGAVRLGYVAYGHQAPKVVYTPISGTKEHTPGMAFGLEALRKGLAPAVPDDLLREAATGAAGSAARPARRQIYLVVNVSPDRSELLINGVVHGQTPYVGEVTCQNGGKLTIMVVPPKGMPKHFEHACDRREIRIDE